MLECKPSNIPALLITTYEGYGDLLCHTPTIRILSQAFPNLDVWCKRPEPFLHNPYIKNLTVLEKASPENSQIYGDRIYVSSVDTVANFPHCTIHGVDLISIKVLFKVLRNTEKTLEAYWTLEDKTKVQRLLAKHPLAKQNRIADGRFVVITPAITWPSRTLPLSFYQELICGIQKRGYGVVLVGKNVEYTSGTDMNKSLYDAAYFPGTISLYNQLTFAQLCALYSITPIAINSQNGNTWVSCTNDFCWNIYIPTLSAPEYGLPYRRGSQYFRATVVGNTANYYPASVALGHGYKSYLNMPILIPSVQEVLSAFDSVLHQLDDS